MKFDALRFGLRMWVLCALVLSAGCSGIGSLHVPLFARNDASDGRSDGVLSLSHLQLKGSHNSYHRAPRFALARSWRYSHAPLDVQLESQGVRQLELDVRYERGEVRVGHLPIVDARTSCRTLPSCLNLIKAWSKKHPRHLPVFVFIEAKDDLAPSGLDGRVDVIESAIASSFPRSALLTPDDVAVKGLSLRDSVRLHGWPALEEAEGRIAFVLFGPARHRREYTAGRKALEGGLMFVASDADRPEVVIRNVDDALRGGQEIKRAVHDGLLVRTRADVDLERDPARRDAALSSGAHFVASDFVDPRHRWVELGHNAPVRCNPISAPNRCNEAKLALLERAILFATADSFTSGP